MAQELVRFKVNMFIGPCSGESAEALAEAIMGLEEFQNVSGGTISVGLVVEPTVTGKD